MKKPKVSVSIITYNHATYIRQAVESVLVQRTNFEYEILIGEDDSSDGTREIVRELVAQHPGKIKPFYRSRADVIYIDGRPTGRANFIATLQAAQGEYVALLEGDDYWTSPTKLQEQIDFLDCHPDYAICSHDVFILKADGTKAPSNWFKKRQPSYDLNDLLTGRFFPPTCSVVFRNHLFGEFPEWFYTVHVADYPLIAMNAQYGRIRHLDQLSGVYRLHTGGIWSQGIPEKDWPLERIIERRKERIELYEALCDYLQGEYRPVIQARISSMSHNVSTLALALEDWKTARKYFLKAIKTQPLNPEMSFIWTLKLMAIVSWPSGYKKYRALKKLISSSCSKNIFKNSP